MNLPRHAEIWLAPYLKESIRRSLHRVPPRRVWVTLADHYEPLGRSLSLDRALGKVARWRDKWPRIAEDSPRDSAGQPPQYTFFYPQEEYRSELLEAIAGIARLGVADVEVHLHHESERRETFIEKVTEFCRRLNGDHGLLRQRGGRIVFGFIHGNWALDNSRPDGKFCGLNGEIALLRDLGCYADFTMPSAPSPTQGRVVNRIYWCTSNADGSPRAFDRGIEATVGGGRHGDLLMITGPLGVRFGERLLPRLEAGEIASYDQPTAERVRRWFDLAPMIGSDLFLKLYAHGADDRNIDALLDRGLAHLCHLVAEEAERRKIELHWATAWQMYQAIETLIDLPRPGIDA